MAPNQLTFPWRHQAETDCVSLMPSQRGMATPSRGYSDGPNRSHRASVTLSLFLQLSSTLRVSIHSSDSWPAAFAQACQRKIVDPVDFVNCPTCTLFVASADAIMLISTRAC
jgi:hypothetical protein